MQSYTFKAPYLIFVGDETRSHFAKTGHGIVHWRRELCSGQLRMTAQTADLGLPDMTVTDALAAGARSLIVGTALIGGQVPAAWTEVLVEAAAAGMDIVAGLHTRLTSIPALVRAAEQGGSRLVDIRTPPADLPVGNGKKRPGKRLLTVGTDCALGKKYTALQLEKDMLDAGMKACFRASGQTGIMIAGEGVPMDCVVADFLSGAAELLSPANDEDHWDVIEGQGGIFHPGYAAVTHGLLLGSQPDAFVVCHAADRRHLDGWPDFPLPTIDALIERTIQIGKLTNPDIHCVGISVNTSAMVIDEREDYLAELSSRYQLPAVDPLINGTNAIIEQLH